MFYRLHFPSFTFWLAGRTGATTARICNFSTYSFSITEMFIKVKALSGSTILKLKESSGILRRIDLPQIFALTEIVSCIFHLLLSD